MLGCCKKCEKIFAHEKGLLQLLDRFHIHLLPNIPYTEAFPYGDNVIKLSTSAHKLLPPSQREGDREAVVGVCGCTVKRG